MKVTFYKILLAVIGAALPASYHPLGGIGKRFRRFCARRIVAQMGEGGNIERGAILHPSMVLGNHSGVGVNCRMAEGVTIGDHVMMAPECMVFTQNHKFDPELLRYEGETEVNPVIIEDHVWIGARCTILPGVTIGKGSTVGANSVVTKSVPPYSVVVGNPARVVKSLID